MKKIIVVVAVVFGACTNSENPHVSDTEILKCETKALKECENIGYGGNDTCYLAFAQDCSAEDTVAAHELCLRQPGAKEPCVLYWR